MNGNGRVSTDGTEIHDRGYRKYEGARSGVAGAVRSLTWQTIRSILGLGRPARHKVFPVIMVVVAVVPAVVFVGFAILARDLGPPANYSDLFAYLGYCDSGIYGDGGSRGSGSRPPRRHVLVVPVDATDSGFVCGCQGLGCAGSDDDHRARAGAARLAGIHSGGSRTRWSCGMVRSILEIDCGQLGDIGCHGGGFNGGFQRH